ncbi:MAG: sulfatase [bacterium]
MMDRKKQFPNIILIVIDALRARNLGCYGDSNELSPNIDKVAQESIVFENAYCCWNSTDPSLTSILSGKYPISHGITNHGDKITREELTTFNLTGTKTLAEVLHQYGYKSMTVDWLGRWFKRGFEHYGYGFKRGFLEKMKYYAVRLPVLYFRYLTGHIGIFRCYIGKRKFKFHWLVEDIKNVTDTFLFSKELAKIQDAGFVTEIGIQLIKEVKKEKFFLFLHYWDTHTPYNCPKGNLTYRGTDSKKVLIAKYEGAVSYIDQQIGRLFEQLRETGVLEDTIIIITSDHGDSLTEHAIFFDHHGLYEETTHVPLILHYPEFFPQAKRVKGFVQHIDLLPTILEILEIDDKGLNFDGTSLIPLIENRVSEIRSFVYNEESYVQKKRAIRTKRYKYITALNGDSGLCRYCHKIHAGSEELYDLEKDPNENINIVNKNISIAEDMKKRLKETINDLINRREKEINDRWSKQDIINSNNQDIYSEKERREVRRKLKSLGYID